MKDDSLKLMFNILKIYMSLIMIYLFCLKLNKVDKVKKLFLNLRDNKEYIIHIRNSKKKKNKKKQP